jgi:hypothetical protein
MGERGMTALCVSFRVLLIWWQQKSAASRAAERKCRIANDEVTIQKTSFVTFYQTIYQEVTFTITTPVRRKVSSSHDSSSMDNFDSLKREATKLERHLEDKVARYQQVGWVLLLVLLLILLGYNG